MAQLSVDGGSNFYGAYDIDLVADDIYRKWDEIEYQMDPGILDRAEEEYGNRGLLALLEQYLLIAWSDIVV